jgi:hypothetical protein
MKNFLRFTPFAAVLFLGTYGASAQVGIRIGPPPPPRVIVTPPPPPGPDFVWVEGYWYPVHGHYRWQEGYWTGVPYPGARWIGPRVGGGLNGYWDGDRGRFEHRHEWDHDRERDHDRYREHDDHHDDHH